MALCPNLIIVQNDFSVTHEAQLYFSYLPLKFLSLYNRPLLSLPNLTNLSFSENERGLLELGCFNQVNILY